MTLERKSEVRRKAFDCIVACECEPNCNGNYGRCAAIWEWALRDGRAGVSLQAITHHDHEATPAGIRRAPTDWLFTMYDHRSFPISRSGLLNDPAFAVCWAASGRCRSADGYSCLDKERKEIIALIDVTRAVDDQPEVFWAAFEMYARTQIEEMLSEHAADVEPYEKCTDCGGAGTRKKSPNEHLRLYKAASSLINVIYDDFTGYLPKALKVLASTFREKGMKTTMDDLARALEKESSA
jgi:hypothetical protein